MANKRRREAGRRHRRCVSSRAVSLTHSDAATHFSRGYMRSRLLLLLPASDPEHGPLISAWRFKGFPLLLLRANHYREHKGFMRTETPKQGESA
jgi:hypothetical protein